MKTFIQWAGDEKRELPVYRQDENTKRSGLAYWMQPDGSIRSHYPDLYFTASNSSAIFQMAPGPPFTPNKHHVSHLTPPDTAIGVNGKKS